MTATSADDAWCPYCDRLRRRNQRSGQLSATCGMADCIAKARGAQLSAYRLSWPHHGAAATAPPDFSAHNIDPPPELGRIPTRPATQLPAFSSAANAYRP